MVAVFIFVICCCNVNQGRNNEKERKITGVKDNMQQRANPLLTPLLSFKCEFYISDLSSEQHVNLWLFSIILWLFLGREESSLEQSVISHDKNKQTLELGLPHLSADTQAPALCLLPLFWSNVAGTSFFKNGNAKWKKNGNDRQKAGYPSLSWFLLGRKKYRGWKMMNKPDDYP